MYPRQKYLGKKILLDNDKDNGENKKEDNIYSEETRERWIDEEILSHEEDGFIKGYVEAKLKKEELEDEENEWMEDEREFFSWKEDPGFGGLK